MNQSNGNGYINDIFNVGKTNYIEKSANQARNGQIWAKRPFSNFPQNSETVIFSTPETRLKTKN